MTDKDIGLPGLIFIPGLACDAALWQPQLAAVPAHWRAVVSAVATQEATIQAMAVRLLADHAGPLALCGASMGAMIALEAARQAPGRVRGLAVLGSTARPESDDMRALRLAAIDLFAQGRVREVLTANVPLAFSPQHAPKVVTDLAQRYLAMIERAGAEQLIAQNRAVMARPDARAHLPALTCPLLVLCGQDDQLTPPECSEELAALAPHATLQLLPRCGHMLTWEQPVAVNAALLGWLARVETCG